MLKFQSANCFIEYDELDANIAAELVVRAKSTHLAPAPGPGAYGAAPPYGGPQYGQNPQHVQPQQPQPAGGQPNLANLITSMDGPALQKLLGAMAQTPQSAHTPQQQTPQQAAQIPDLAALLGNVTRQPQPQQGYPYTGHQQPQSQPNVYPAVASNPAFANNPALSSLLGDRPPQQGMLNQQMHMQPGQQQHHVQNIMDQLARYKQ